MLKRIIACLTIVSLLAIPTTAFAGTVPSERNAWTQFPYTYQGHALSRNTYAIQFFLQYYDSYCFTEICDHGGTDGNFGVHTANAVRHFQSLNGLTADGIVGPQTWGKIYDILDGPMALPPLDNQPEAGYSYYWVYAWANNSPWQFHRKVISTGQWQTYDKNYNWIPFGY